MKILLLNQCFWPDVVATSQQLTALARRLSDAGHEVTVIAARRGYDDPTDTFSRRERWNGIDIIRVSSINLGKKNRATRFLNFGSFLFTCGLRMLSLPRQDVVVALTSPPFISWLASLFTKLRGGELVFWVMDLNPDEAIAAGWLKQNSITAKLLSRLLRSSMRRARTIVALDDYMKEKIVGKGIPESKVHVIRPMHDESVHFDEEGRQAFREAHGLAERFVVMYAGNHSPCHPLNTLLAAADQLKTNTGIAFLFVGGGSEFDKVKSFAHAHELNNVICLPYQPQASLPAVLSAADLHIVVMGDPFVGIVHPSKIYNILAVGAPFIFIGPEKSSMGGLVSQIADPSLARRFAHRTSAELAHAIAEAARHSGQRIPAERVAAHDSPARLLEVIEATSPIVSHNSAVEVAVASSSRADFVG